MGEIRQTGTPHKIMKFMIDHTSHAQHFSDVAQAVGGKPTTVNSALARLARQPGGTGISKCPDVGRGWYIYRPVPGSSVPATTPPPGPERPAEDTFSPDSTMFEFLGRSSDGTMLVRQPETATIWKLEAF